MHLTAPHLSTVPRAGALLVAATLAFALGGCGDKDGDDSGGSAGGDDGGADGADGAEGEDGEDGTEGTDGTDGTDGGDGAEDPSPTVVTAEYLCSVSGSADDTIIFQFTVDDPQGADTIDRTSGVVSCLDPGGSDIFGTSPLPTICSAAGECTGSMPTTSYPMDCTNAPDHTCSVTIMDDTGNSGTGTFTWVGR